MGTISTQYRCRYGGSAVMTGGRSNIDSTSGDSYSAGVVASLLSSHVIGCMWCPGFQFFLCHDTTVTGTRGLYHDVHIGTQRQHHLKNHNCKQHGCREQERITGTDTNSNSDTSTPTGNLMTASLLEQQL